MVSGLGFESATADGQSRGTQRQIDGASYENGGTVRQTGGAVRQFESGSGDAACCTGVAQLPLANSAETDAAWAELTGLWQGLAAPARAELLAMARRTRGQ